MIRNLCLIISTSFLITACSLSSSPKVITNKNYQTHCSPLILKKNDRFFIKLPSSQFSGYKWKIEDDQNDILQLIENKTQQDDTPENHLRREETIWEYKAISDGKTTLSFIYLLDWDNNIQDGQRVQCNVSVEN